MDIQLVYQTLDVFFANRNTAGAQTYLIEVLEQSKNGNDNHSTIMILNELMGFYRETSQKERVMETSQELLEWMSKCNLEGTLDYATVLLNIANAYRGVLELELSLSYYKQVIPIYNQKLNEDDFLYASLYNNVSLLYQELHQYEQAFYYLEQALELAKKTTGKEFEVAVTYTNMAETLCKLHEESREESSETLAKAENYSKLAIGIFEKRFVFDMHYAAARASLAEVYYLKKQMVFARNCLQQAIYCLEHSVGKTIAYGRMQDNLLQIEKKIVLDQQASNQGIGICFRYYEMYGKKMIHSLFREYENEIAIGLMGEGSDCLGFDDEVSRDHDFGPGFSMWVPVDIYSKIGDQLEMEYDKLPKTFEGMERVESYYAKGRVGVSTMEDYFVRIIGQSSIPTQNLQWLEMDDSKLRALSSGMIFFDQSGQFTRLIRQIKYKYPENLRLRKIAQELFSFSQNGQYNFKRAMIRKDSAAAFLHLAEMIRAAAKLIYLLNEDFAPHDKWLVRGLSNCYFGYEVKEDLERILQLYQESGKSNLEEAKTLDRICERIEVVSSKILFVLGVKRIVSEYSDHYLANYGVYIMEKVFEIEKKENMIEEIIQLEWMAFDQVQNEGGRAQCQNNYPTFHIMRKSQYLEWTLEMLECYKNDFQTCFQVGRNLITEKYARMMESTSPREYEKIKDQFDEIPEEKVKIIEEIVKIQVGWMEEFAAKYPTLSNEARVIHTYEDQEYETSYETYLRGELSTYSDEMIGLYGRFIVQLVQRKINLAEKTILNTVRMYGYENLDEAKNVNLSRSNKW